MNLALASLVLAAPCGFVTDAQLPAIIAADRLCWLLVRCGAQHGRFSAPAQNIAQLIATIEATGDWVRDVSFPSYVIEEAKAFLTAHPTPVPPVNPLVFAPVVKTHNETATGGLTFDGEASFSESDCGGVFDGYQVTSDADPGL